MHPHILGRLNPLTMFTMRTKQVLCDLHIPLLLQEKSGGLPVSWRQ